MARGCDYSVCQEKAISVGLFAGPLGDKQTRAACSPDHQELLDQDLKARGFHPEWGPLITSKRLEESGGPHA